MTPHRGRWSIAGLLCLLLGIAELAGAQATLTLSADVVTPGTSLTATVTGPAGQFFAIVGSSVGSGLSYGGVALAVGTDVVMLGQGVLGSGGSASVGLTPPFAATTLDRYYLQAATSPAANFLPLSVSSGRVVRNGDLVTGLTGPQGPVGPQGPQGAQGVVATNGSGAYDFANLNGFVAAGTVGSGALAATGIGTRLLWYPGKAAFRAGTAGGTEWDDASIGFYSVATGYETTASGLASVATGAFNVASGAESTAMGAGTVASGTYGTAMGHQTTASGTSSTAMGDQTTASATSSTAMGAQTTASGNYSTAMGRYADTDGRAGAFVYGDASTSTEVQPTANNQFVVRANGGTRFYSNAAMTTGVNLAAGGGAWAALSDAAMKANFRDVDGEDVLAKLARIPIREWNYLSQDAGIRHVGPTAQDFHAAFGLGDDDRTITTIDPDGISLRAIQALDERTRRLQEDNDALRKELAALRAALAHVTGPPQ